jgi:glycerol-3-phosphate acyltransferase PlsY
MTFYILIIAAYLQASIPWGFIIARLRGVNIKKVGSGNIGATNVTRALGFQFGVLTALLDILKGAAPAALAFVSLNSQFQIMLVMLAAILGNIFPIFLKFKGGKGISTSFGVLLILMGWQIMSLVLVIWFILLVITRYMSITNILLILYLPLYFVFVNLSVGYFIFSVIVMLLIFWAHRNNIKRLQAGKELKLNFKKYVKTR